MESLKLSESKWITLSEKGLLLPLLVVFHNRLLLEDVMAMEIDQELVLLIHQTNKLVKGENKTWQSRRIKTIGDSHVPERLNYTMFQSNLYWAHLVVVVSNPQHESLLNKVYTEHEIVRGCTQHGGWGVRVQLGTNEQKNILFHDLLLAPEHLQLWATDTHTNYQTMNKKLRCLSGLNLAGTTKRLLDEEYGDALLCKDICHPYTTQISALVDTVKSTVV